MCDDDRIEDREAAKESADKVSKTTSPKAALSIVSTGRVALGSVVGEVVLSTAPTQTRVAKKSASASKGEKNVATDWRATFAEYLPLVAGARLQPVPSRRCVVGYYHRERPLVSKTSSWSAIEGKGTSLETAFRNSLRWVWAAHAEATGKACPIDWATCSFAASLIERALAA